MGKLLNSALLWGRNQVLELNETLGQLMAFVISAHDEKLGRDHTQLDVSHQNIEGQALPTVLSTQTPSHLEEVLTRNFRPVSAAIVAAKSHPDSSMQYSARAWVNFAVGCLTLFVPDRAFDPDKRQRLERGTTPTAKKHTRGEAYSTATI